MPRTLDGRVRTVVAAVAIALVVIVPLVLLFAGGGDGDDAAEEAPDATALRIERAANQLIVYVEPADNVPERAGGARRVVLRCVDASDQLVIAQDEAWPFTDTDAGTLDAHAHVTLDPGTLDAVSSCHLLGTEPRLEGAAP
jgi:hypothetical protein